MIHHYLKRKIVLRITKRGTWMAEIRFLTVPEYAGILEKMHFVNSDEAFNFCCDLIDGKVI